MKNTAILFLWCKDKKGIVAEITTFIYKSGGNILNCDHYTDVSSSQLFMRIEWNLEGFKIPQDKILLCLNPIKNKFKMSFHLDFSNYVPNMAIFVSKCDHCLTDLILRQKSGELNSNIKLIISNHLDLQYLSSQFNIPFYHFPITNQNKTAIENNELKLLKKEKIDLIVLARYMQILSPRFINFYKNRIINIHHSFLPAFIGSNPYQQALDRGVKIIGATSHYVTKELDQGPIIEQFVTRITHKDDLPEIIRKGKDLERTVLSRSIRLHLEHKIMPYGKRTIIFD